MDKILEKRQPGFTIIELLIVIVVIGILAAITIVAFNGIQARAHDAERQADTNAIYKALLLYGQEFGVYPSNAQMKDSNWIRANLPNIANETIINPLAPSGTTSSIISVGFSPITNTNKETYHYRNTDTYQADSNGNLVTNSGCIETTQCKNFILAWGEETTSAISYLYSPQ